MLWVLVFFVAYQQVENYVFSPRITKRTMEIHPAVSVAAIIIGANLMGGVGVILALPMTGIVQAIISESGKRHDVVLDGEEAAKASESALNCRLPCITVSPMAARIAVATRSGSE